LRLESQRFRHERDTPKITAIESDIILYEPGSGPIPISDIFECEDVDNEHLNFAEIKLIDSSYSERNDELIFENADTSPIRGIYDATTGVLSLIGLATPEQYMEAIRSVKYNYRLTTDENGEPSQISTNAKIVSITLSDGQLFSTEATREINLETSVELNIPNAFTPNGDTENNTWAIRPVTPTDQFNNTIVRVYNKRGLLVYESTGIEKEWDGTFNGELLPVDTYYYTIDLKLSFIKKTYKGAVTILR
jgi:gliding motility-associated-like protein